MPFTANYFGVNVVEEVWYEKAMAALVRLGLSGVIYYHNVGFDIRIILKKCFSIEMKGLGLVVILFLPCWVSI